MKATLPSSIPIAVLPFVGCTGEDAA